MQRIFSFMVVAVFVLLALPLGEAGAAARNQPRPVAQKPAVEALYTAAASEWRALLRDEARAGKRESWSTLERRFLDILAKDPVGETGGKSRYQAARCRERIAGISFAKADWQAAADHYLALARDFPRNSLADDGLFHAASILNKHLNNPEGARRAAQRITVEYPRGDMAGKAQALLASLPKKAAPSGGEGVRGANAASVAQALPAHAGTLTTVSIRNAARRSSVFLELDGAASFSHQFLAPTSDGQPARIQIDIAGVGMGKSVKALTVQSGKVAAAVRVMPLAAQGAGGTRVIVELDAARLYTVDTSVSPPGIVVQCSRAGDLAGGKTPPGDGKNGPVTQGRFSGVSPARPGTLLEQLGLTVQTIMIDAGHGGKDPGATGNGVRESDITLKLALLLGERLKKQGFTVLYTRTRDVYVALEQRAVIANEKKADLFISLHVNASKDAAVNGLETYFLDLARSSSAATVAARENAVSVKSISDLQFILTDIMLTSKLQESHDLASLLHTQMFERVRQAGFSVNDNGVRSAPFYVLMGARMPAALVEIGYLSNQADARRIVSAKYLERLADGLTQGVIAYKNKLNRFNR